MDQQRRVLFCGRVQGVGFRYAACRIAAGYDVVGYVKNLPDGRVELMAEGPADQIDAMLHELNEQMGGYVTRRLEQTSEPSGQYSRFGVA